MNKLANQLPIGDVFREVGASCGSAGENLQWLLAKMNSYFAISMPDKSKPSEQAVH